MRMVDEDEAPLTPDQVKLMDLLTQTLAQLDLTVRGAANSTDAQAATYMNRKKQ